MQFGRSPRIPWEPARLKAANEIPGLRKYTSDIDCSQHGPKPLRHTRSGECVLCCRQYDKDRRSIGRKGVQL